MTRAAGTEEPPDISVITVVFNGAAHLEQCIQSVRAQTGVRCEHIVIDGASSDGSVDMIRRYTDGLSDWISEPDRGIGEAMNKGIARAHGKWLLFLHADDYLLEPDSLSRCGSRLVRSYADIIGFPIRFGLPGQFRVLHPRGGNIWLNLKTGLLHQACFIRRDLFDHLGGYDTELRIAMDYEFFLRAWRAGAIFETADTPVLSFMRATGLSSQQDWPSLRQRFTEERAIHFRHASSAGLKLFYRAYWPAYTVYRWLRWRLSP